MRRDDKKAKKSFDKNYHIGGVGRGVQPDIRREPVFKAGNVFDSVSYHRI